MNNQFIKILELSTIGLPEFKEIRGKEWVSFGNDNVYPQKLIELLQTSAIHNTAVKAKVDASVGEGVLNYGENIVNQNGETLNDIYMKIALDYIIFGGYSLNCIWNRGGDKVVEIYHIPFNNIRSEKMNDEDRVEHYYYSSNWGNTRKYKPIKYKSFDMTDNKGENASQIFYYYDYTPGNDIYPLPSYVGALNDIQLDARISNYHNNNISNGFSGGILINLPNGEPTDDEKRALYKDLVQSFTGTDNAGRLFLSFSEGQELAPQIQSINSTTDDYYITLEQRVSSRVLTSHRITSPLLVGIRDTSTGLGNNANEIEVAYTHFMSSVIEPIQKSLNKSISVVLKPFGVEEKIQVIPSTLDFNKNIQGEV